MSTSEGNLKNASESPRRLRKLRLGHRAFFSMVDPEERPKPPCLTAARIPKPAITK